MDADCYVRNYDALLKAFGSPLRYSGQSLVNDGWIICHFKNHFVVVDSDCNVIYDPLGLYTKVLDLHDIRVFK